VNEDTFDVIMTWTLVAICACMVVITGLTVFVIVRG